MLGAVDHGAERSIRRGELVALDQHLLDLMLRKGIVDGAGGPARLADPALSCGLGLRPHGTADGERDDNERQPPPDRLLSVLGAPATHPSGQVPSCGCSHLSLSSADRGHRKTQDLPGTTAPTN